MKHLIAPLAIALASVTASAQTNTTVATTAAPESTVSAPFKLKAPTFGPMKLKMGVKSTGLSARASEFEDSKGRRYKQKHEYSVGAVHKSGWGAVGQAVTSGTSYGDSRKDTLSGGDPTLTILHPDL